MGRRRGECGDGGGGEDWGIQCEFLVSSVLINCWLLLQTEEEEERTTFLGNVPLAPFAADLAATCMHTDRQTDGQTDGRTDGQKDERSGSHVHTVWWSLAVAVFQHAPRCCLEAQSARRQHRTVREIQYPSSAL